MAASSSRVDDDVVAATPITKPTINLVDLTPDVLMNILRYVPLQHKMSVLKKMREFQELLEHRSSFLEYQSPFSFKYCEYVNLIRTGWFVEDENWKHWLFIQIDEATLTINMRHFVLSKPDWSSEPNSFFLSIKRDTFKKMTNLFDQFLFKYTRTDHIQLLTYFLDEFGQIMIHYSFNSHAHKMQFLDGTQHILEENVSLRIARQRHSSAFYLRLKPDKILEVKYINILKSYQYPRNRSYELVPFMYEVSEDFRYLKRPSADFPFSIPFTTYHQFKLDDRDGKFITWSKIYRVDEKPPDAVPITDSLKRDPSLKKLFSEGTF